MAKAKTMWVKRLEYYHNSIECFTGNTRKDHRAASLGYFTTLCYKHFKAYTGLSLKPGEERKIRLSVEVLK